MFNLKLYIIFTNLQYQPNRTQLKFLFCISNTIIHSAFLKNRIKCVLFLDSWHHRLSVSTDKNIMSTQVPETKKRNKIGTPACKLSDEIIYLHL